MDRVEQVLAALPAEPTLATGHLVLVDGLAGSGKTTLATALATRTGATVLHTDDLLEGWSGLPGLAATLERVLRPLARGPSTTVRRWDWHAGRFGPETVLSPGPLLVVEGVGASVGTHRDLAGVRVFVDANAATRRERWLARDGAEAAGHIEAWQRAEDALHEMAGTAGRADLRFRG